MLGVSFVQKVDVVNLGFHTADTGSNGRSYECCRVVIECRSSN